MQTIGIFGNPDTINCITGQFKAVGLDHSSLSLVVRDQQEPGETRPGAAAGPATAATVAKGSLIGGLAGLIVGVSTVLVPGIGPIIVGGPLATTLSGIVATLSGVAAGTTIGALAGMIGNIGVPERQAQEYASVLRHGDGLVLVEHDGSRDVEGIFRHCGCRDIRSYHR
ncbi:MAG: hypothetical protein ACRDGN_13050 [bacterium]